MKIAIVSPLEIRVPPVAYGGTELVVNELCDELVHRGHDVTLFASGDSITNARLVSVVPEYLRKSNSNPRFFSLLNMVKCYERAESFDIIHNHIAADGLLLAGMSKIPTLTTLHSPLHGDENLAFKFYSGWYNTISKSAQPMLPKKKNYVGTIYNGIDCSKYPFDKSKRGGYLLYFSRFSPEKGAHLAIKVARKLKRQLVLAGNLADKEYFRKEIQPYVDGKMIRSEIEVDDHRKKQLMANADCLLAPLLWDEPFGLFMIEALACGTPVIAFNRGSVPELISDHETGFVVDSVDELIDSIGKISSISPRVCRERVLKNFDAKVMTDNYLTAYRGIITQNINSAPKLVVKK